MRCLRFNLKKKQQIVLLTEIKVDFALKEAKRIVRIQPSESCLFNALGYKIMSVSQSERMNMEYLKLMKYMR